jgi:hypothetical protein
VVPRVARIENTIYIDLGDDTFRAIEVTADRWKVIDAPRVLFVRSEYMQPLPEPVAGGSIDDFRPFFPTGADEDLRLLLTFLVDAYTAPEGSARPILAFDGPPGSAKTTMTDFVKRLTDPQVGGLFAPSQDERDLVIAARWNHVVAFDNASRISLKMSDALCRLTSGGGLRVRKLYTDESETVFDERRHVILNSIGDVARQADLRDRCLFVSASRLTSPRDETELGTAFEEARARLFGVLLDAAVRTLADEKRTLESDTHLPRMAGFARRGAACAPVLGWSGAEFLRAYRANIEQAALDFVEDDLVARALLAQSWHGVRNWLEKRMGTRGVPEEKIKAARSKWGDGVVWRGSATDLMDYLDERVGSVVTQKFGWPRDPRWFGRQLKQVSVALQKAGLELEYPRTGRERLVVIRRIAAGEGEPPDLDDTRVGSWDREFEDLI